MKKDSMQNIGPKEFKIMVCDECPYFLNGMMSGWFCTREYGPDSEHFFEDYDVEVEDLIELGEFESSNIEDGNDFHHAIANCV